MTASDVIAPDVIAPDRGAITSGRRIQVSVRETHGPQRPLARKPQGPGRFSFASFVRLRRPRIVFVMVPPMPRARSSRRLVLPASSFAGAFLFDLPVTELAG